MLSNYFRIAIRSLLKSKVYTFINVFGLAFGIACVFLIILYLQNELSYDRFHAKAENLYRVTWEDNNPQTRTPHPMAQAMKADFPEVESAVSITPLYAAGLTKETHSLHNPRRDTRYDEMNILAVDTTFFDVFSFSLLKGNPKNALKQLNGVLLSESMAQKYFPGEDPIGQHLAVDAENYLVEVVGVFKDVPRNSHFHFDFLVSYLREKSFDNTNAFYSWADFGHYNYIRLREGADTKALEEKLMPWMRKYIPVSDEQYQGLIDQGYGFRLQPVTDIHLKSSLRWELEPNGNIEYVYILSAAALLTLIIACVNFMNLTTAKSAERAKEIGVRKTLGAAQRQLSLQFLAESVLIALISIAIAILIVEVTLPFFNSFADLAFEIDYGQHGLMLLVLGIFIGILSGLYPSAYLSGIKPQLVLKGRMAQSPKGAGFRRGLIVFQFFMSMILVSSALIIFGQLDFLTSKHLGFEKEAVLVIPVKNELGLTRFDAFQSEMSKIDGIISASASSNIPGGQFNQHHISSLEFPDDDISSSEAFVDYDFFKTLDIPLQEGRTFTRNNPPDSGAAFVLNETAARQLNLKGPVVGREIWWKQREQNAMRRGTVIGVVKDFHFQSLHEPIRPLVFVLTQRRFNHILVKLETENFSDKIAAIEKVYKQFEPVYGFEFSFLEDRLNAQYSSEKRTGTILGIFTVIAILIASFGLFGMSLLTFQQKIKELSVRKVLGATLANMLVLLVGGFTKLIIVAVLLATPLAWWIMNSWLQNFSYRISIHPLVFAGSGLALILIAWVTLSYFTVMASRLNPAETLKNE
ncbi:MAG: ABC transporter permease [Cyclobacteriaceae bacterium]